MRIYVAGPITGVPLKNRPAFTAAAQALRAEGHEVVNPLEIDPRHEDERTWADHMRIDIPQLLQCEAIALLPGWEHSRGARLEAYNARELGMPFIYLKPPSPVALAQAAAEERE